MPRRRNYRKTYRRRKRVPLATQVKKISLSQAETKRKEQVALNSTTITSTVSSYALHDISSGDTRDTRDGESVLCRAVGGRFTVGWNSGATSAAIVTRFVLYHPYQQDDLLTSMNYASYIEPERYKVYFDKLVTVNTENPLRVINIGKKFYNKYIQGMKMQWTTGTGTDISRGALYLAIVSSEVTNGTNVNGRLQVYYKDP